MKIAWLILLVSAFTDFVITAGTGAMTVLAAALIEPAVKEALRPLIFLAPVIGGVVSAARTIQQALKMTPEMAASLKGTPTVTTTKEITKPGEPEKTTVVASGPVATPLMTG